MAKKRSKSKPSSASTYKKSLSHARETEKLLVENFVGLQKVMVNLSGKLDDLTTQISELLKLFEDSAKVIVKGEMEKKNEDRGEKQLLDTMISILDQNKVIAKGLTLIYESMNETEIPQRSVMEREPERTVIMPARTQVKREERAPEKKKLVKEDKGYSFSRSVTASSPFPPRM